MAITNKSQLANGTATQQNLYNQALARQAQLNNQQKYLQMAQVSPYFALGNMIGNMIADRYNSRGVNKEKEAISNALSAYTGNQDYASMNNILNSPSVLDATQGMNINPNDANNSILDSVTPSVTLGAGEQPLDISNLPQDGGITISSIPTNKADLNSFNLDNFKSKYYEDARKRGRTDAQINEAWSTMQPQITELANKAKEARIDTAFSALTPGEDGKYSFGEISMSNPKFVNYLRPLMKDSPELATLLVKGATAKDSENAAMARLNNANMAKAVLQGNNQKFQLTRDNINNAIKIAAAKIRADSKKTNNKNNPSGINDQRYKNIKTALDKLELIEKGDGITTGRQLTTEEQRQKDMLKAQANAYLYGEIGNSPAKNPNTPQTQYKQPNINQYSQELIDDIGRGIATLSKKNYPKDRIIAEIKRMYANQIAANGGGAGYIDQILQGVDWGETGYDVRGR